jgi:hypothetical protein
MRMFSFSLTQPGSFAVEEARFGRIKFANNQYWPCLGFGLADPASLQYAVLRRKQ